MNKNKPVQNLDSDYDFGFSFTSQEEVSSKSSEDLRNQIEREHKRALDLYEAIIPFLIKLKSNPEKDTILWPNRVLHVDSFITKLGNILESK